MYLTIHLVLFTGAFLLFAGKLCTCLPFGGGRQPPPRRPLRTGVSRGGGVGGGYRPVNRISRYLR